MKSMVQAMQTTMELLEAALPRMCKPGREFAGTLPSDPAAALASILEKPEDPNEYDAISWFYARSLCYELNLASAADLFTDENGVTQGAACRQATARAVDRLRAWLLTR